jgi:hypothetical protein
VVAALLERLGKPWSLVRTVADRLGHDRRYAMDGSKLAALGWQNRTTFADGIASTVDWFVANEAWWRAIRGGDWDAYYARQYGSRLAGSEPAGATPEPAGAEVAGSEPAGAEPGVSTPEPGAATRKPAREPATPTPAD